MLENTLGNKQLLRWLEKYAWKEKNSGNFFVYCIILYNIQKQLMTCGHADKCIIIYVLFWEANKPFDKYISKRIYIIQINIPTWQHIV